MAMRGPVSELAGRLAATVAMVAGLTFVFFRVFPANATTASLGFMLLILGVSSTWGLVAGSTAAVKPATNPHVEDTPRISNMKPREAVVALAGKTRKKTNVSPATIATVAASRPASSETGPLIAIL